MLIRLAYVDYCIDKNLTQMGATANNSSRNQLIGIRNPFARLAAGCTAFRNDDRFCSGR